MVAHWSDRYIGKPYIAGVADCASLAIEVVRDRQGRGIEVPVEHSAHYLGQSKQILRHKDDLADKIDAPEDGSPALFYGRGRLCHIGVMCWIANEWWVLHADQVSGFVIRQRLRDMTRVLYKLEGYYRWK